MVDDLTLRQVKSDDCRVLWEWANDPQTRAASFNSERIPWDQHVAWFNERLRDPNSVIFIAVVGETPVGVVRFSVHGESAELSITVGPEFRGRGYGKAMLRLAVEQVLRDGRVKWVDAFVKASNSRSASTFQAAGFVLMGEVRRNGEPVMWFQKRRNMESDR